MFALNFRYIYSHYHMINVIKGGPQKLVIKYGSLVIRERTSPMSKLYNDQAFNRSRGWCLSAS